MDIEVLAGLAQAGGGVVFLLGLVYVYRAGEAKEKRLASEVRAREDRMTKRLDELQNYIMGTMEEQIEKNIVAMNSNAAANRELAQAIHQLPCRAREHAG